MTGDKWGEVIQNLILLMKKQIPVQTCWVTAKEIQWEEGTMTCTDILSDLDMWDVFLGLGSVKIKPKIGSKCLLGIVNNNEGLGYLIFAEEIDEIAITSDLVNINDGKNGGLIKIEELVKKINALEERLNTHQHSYATPSGPAITTANPTEIPLAATKKSELENPKVKH